MLFAGGMLYPTVILPAVTPVKGVLNAAGKPVGLDFVLFYGAGSLAREGRAIAAYDDRAFSEAESLAATMKVTGLAWPYPPGMLLVARAVASLPYLQAAVLWALLGALCLALMVWRASGMALLVLPLALCPAATYAGMLGQVSLYRRGACRRRPSPSAPPARACRRTARAFSPSRSSSRSSSPSACWRHANIAPSSPSWWGVPPCSCLASLMPGPRLSMPFSPTPTMPLAMSPAARNC